MSDDPQLYQLALKTQAEGNQRGLISLSKRILSANPTHLPTWQLLHRELGNGQNLYTFIEVWGQQNLPQINAHLFPRPEITHSNTNSALRNKSISASKPNSSQAEAIIKTNPFSSANVKDQTLPSSPQREELQRTSVLKSEPADRIPLPEPEPHPNSLLKDTQEIRVRKTARTSAPTIPLEPEPDWLDMVEGISSPKNDALPTGRLQESPSPGLQQPEWLDLVEAVSSPRENPFPAQKPPRSSSPTTRQPISPSPDLDPQCLSLLEHAAQARAASNEEAFERALIRLIDRGKEILPGLARYRSRQPVNSPAWETAEEILCRMLKVPTRKMIKEGGNLPRTARTMTAVGFILGIFIAIFAADPSVALFVPFILSFLLWMFTWFYGQALSRDGSIGRVLIILLPFIAIYRASQHHSILREWKESRQTYEKYLKDLIKQPSNPGMNGNTAAPAAHPTRNATPQAAPMPAAPPPQPNTIPTALDIRVARHGPFTFAPQGSSRYSLALKNVQQAWMVKYDRKEKGNIDAEIFPPHIEPKIIRKQFPPSEQAWYIFEKLPKTSKKETAVKIWRGMHTQVGMIVFVGNFLGGNKFWLSAPWMGLDAGFLAQIIGGSTIGIFITKTEAVEPLLFFNFKKYSTIIQIERNPKFEEMPPDLEELLLMISFYISPTMTNPT